MRQHHVLWQSLQHSIGNSAGSACRTHVCLQSVLFCSLCVMLSCLFGAFALMMLLKSRCCLIALGQLCYVRLHQFAEMLLWLEGYKCNQGSAVQLMSLCVMVFGHTCWV